MFHLLLFVACFVVGAYLVVAKERYSKTTYKLLLVAAGIAALTVGWIWF